MTGIIGFSLLGSNICNPIEEFSSIPKAHTYLHLRIRAIQLIRKSCNLQGVVFPDERWRKTFLRITCIVAVALLFSLVCQYRGEQSKLDWLHCCIIAQNTTHIVHNTHTKVISITELQILLCFVFSLFVHFCQHFWPHLAMLAVNPKTFLSHWSHIMEAPLRGNLGR